MKSKTILRSLPAKKRGAAQKAQANRADGGPADVVTANVPLSNSIQAHSRPNESPEMAMARMRLNPSLNAASTIQRSWHAGLFEVNPAVDIPSLINALDGQASAVNNGDLTHTEAILTAQVQTLDSLFHSLARRAIGNMGHSIDAVEAYMKLALRAQSQSRATSETLATIKNPPIFAKQANIAQGHQQVNNGVASPVARARAEDFPTEQSKLLEQDNAQRMDAGTQSQAIKVDSQVEAVAPIDRATDR